MDEVDEQAFDVRTIMILQLFLVREPNGHSISQLAVFEFETTPDLSLSSNDRIEET